MVSQKKQKQNKAKNKKTKQKNPTYPEIYHIEIIS